MRLLRSESVVEVGDGVIVCQLTERGMTRLGSKRMTKAAQESKKGDTAEVGFLQRGSIAGIVLGIIVFLGGIALLALTFDLAIEMFRTDPSTLFGLQGKPLDVNKAVTTLMGVVIRILLLLVMAIVGGVVANRGIHLYADSRASTKAVLLKSEPERRKERTG